MSYLYNIPVNYLVDLNIWRSVSIIHNCKNIKINVWTSVHLQSRRQYKHNFFLLSVYAGGFMELNQKIFFSQMELRDLLSLSQQFKFFNVHFFYPNELVQIHQENM